MYSNCYTYPSSSYNYPLDTQMTYPSYASNQSDDRFIGGGFAAPFLLGGLAGAALAPAFYNRPFYSGYPGYGYPMAPCCPPRFW